MIEFENVYSKYSEDSKYVLDNLNFIIRPGEKIGIIGRTGAGKSSLVKVLLNFLDSIDGSIYIDGHSVLEKDVRFLRR